MDRKEEYNIIAEKVVGHFQNDTTDQTKAILTIPTSDYTDKDRWKKEIDEIFLKLPLMLSLAIEIPNHGDYKALEIVGIPVLITRDKESKVHAFRNVCSHRGSLLTKEEIGNKNNFTCPYHGWTYSNKGDLIGITDNEKFGNLDKSCRGLQELPCQELGGMIFVILTPNLDLNLDEFLGGMKSEIEHFDFKNWYYHGFKVIHGANWKVAFDGYLEGYHFSTAHKDTILDMTMQDIMDFSAFGPHLRIAADGPAGLGGDREQRLGRGLACTDRTGPLRGGQGRGHGPDPLCGHGGGRGRGPRQLRCAQPGHAPLPLQDHQPGTARLAGGGRGLRSGRRAVGGRQRDGLPGRSEEHTSELQSRTNLVCRLLLAKKKH